MGREDFEGSEDPVDPVGLELVCASSARKQGSDDVGEVVIAPCSSHS
jgi:hypothetical protein